MFSILTIKTFCIKYNTKKNLFNIDDMLTTFLQQKNEFLISKILGTNLRIQNLNFAFKNVVGPILKPVLLVFVKRISNFFRCFFNFLTSLSSIAGKSIFRRFRKNFCNNVKNNFEVYKMLVKFLRKYCIIFWQFFKH